MWAGHPPRWKGERRRKVSSIALALPIGLVIAADSGAAVRCGTGSNCLAEHQVTRCLRSNCYAPAGTVFRSLIPTEAARCVGSGCRDGLANDIVAARCGSSVCAPAEPLACGGKFGCGTRAESPSGGKGRSSAARCLGGNCTARTARLNVKLEAARCGHCGTATLELNPTQRCPTGVCTRAAKTASCGTSGRRDVTGSLKAGRSRSSAARGGTGNCAPARIPLCPTPGRALPPSLT
jgi:hypothetical protein